METAVNFLFETFEKAAEPSQALITLQEADRSRDNTFSLSEILSFLPDRRHDSLCELIALAIQPAVENFTSPSPIVNANHEQLIEIGSQMTWQLVQHRKTPAVAKVAELIQVLHCLLLKIPVSQSQNTISRCCEWMWIVNDKVNKQSVIAYMLPYLLLRSIGDETYFVSNINSNKKRNKSGTLSDVKRIYTIRKAFADIDLTANKSSSMNIRNVLLRCATTSNYLNEAEGRKFIAYTLSIEEIRDAMFDTIKNQLCTIRQDKAALYGNVILQSWITNRSDWLVEQLIKVAELSLLGMYSPLLRNLTTLFDSFHGNRRFNGIDLLLYRVYTPVLFGNLYVANPDVRKSSVLMLAGAFPVHDPGSSREQVESVIQSQSTILLDLLTDDSPMVRCAAIEGSCRVLAFMYEIMPVLTAKKIVDTIVSKLAFDISSALVRISVLKGLKLLFDNKVLHSTLVVCTKVLKPLITDRVEKVRIGMLDLLHKVKSNRMASLKYFDIVPVEDLLCMLVNECEATSMHVMKLIVSSYFPVEGDKRNEIQISQVKACLSMLQTNPKAARFFYKHLNMFVRPGALLEFALQISQNAIEAPSSLSSTKTKQKPKLRKRTRRRIQDEDEENGGDDNVAPSNANIEEENDEHNSPVCKELLLTTVSDILESIRPSLQKEKNKSLRTYIDEIFQGNALKPLLSTSANRENSVQTRAATWRIASCVSVSHIGPLIVLWREEMDTIVDWNRATKSQVENYMELITAFLVCAFRWKLIPTLLAVIAGWGDGAANGLRTARVGVKMAKRGGRGGKSKRIGRTKADQGIDDLLEGREGNLYALQAVGNIIMDDEISTELILSMNNSNTTTPTPSNRIDDDDDDDDDETSSTIETPPSRILTCIRKGVLGAYDHMLETLPDNATPSQVPEFSLLLQTLSTSLKASVTYAMRRELISGEGRLKDVLEVIEWLGGKEHLWNNLKRLHYSFSTSLSSVCIALIADAAALLLFNEADLNMICQVCELVSECLSSVNGNSDDYLRHCSRVIMEMLRLGVLIDEQCNDDTEDDNDTGKKKKDVLKKDTGVIILLNAFDIAKGIEVKDESRQTGEAFEPSHVQEFIMKALHHICHSRTRSEFEKEFSSYFCSRFGGDQAVDTSFIVSTVCNGLRSMVTSGNIRGLSRKVDDSISVFDFISSCLVLNNDDHDKQELMTFVTYVCKSFIKHYDNLNMELEEEGEGGSHEKLKEKTKPTLEAVKFFNHVKQKVKETLGEGQVGNDEENIRELLADNNDMLTMLINMRERAVGEQQTQ